MTVTIQLDDALVQDLERFAAQRQHSVSSLVEITLKELLQKEGRGGHRELPVFYGGRGLQPGVDLDHSAALLDWMEQLDVAG
jgi:hypothetical protein